MDGKMAATARYSVGVCTFRERGWPVRVSVCGLGACACALRVCGACVERWRRKVNK